MPLLGAHMSIAGGCHHALLAAKEHGCEAVQIFTKNTNQWRARVLTEEDIRTFKTVFRQTRLRLSMAHTSYLINLASPVDSLYRRSVEAFVEELHRAEQLGLHYLVIHPGASKGSAEEAGLQRVAAALDETHRRCPRYRVRILLETTAGQGSCLGHRFEHLARIFQLLPKPNRVGICFDTCHVFAAGYPLAPAAEYQTTIQKFDDLIGLKRLRAFHLNDSLKPLGSRVDRHAHIGRGHLGLEPFRLLLNDPRFDDRPMVIETPKENEMDRVNLGVLRGLLG